MASFKDLAYDWSTLCQECTECWTASDLQLAAELGKTLLERNKELEVALRRHQGVVDDQAQEIEYLTKQTVALREVNDSRLRIYEQLEVSIQDLERANHRLATDHTADKKHIKTLCSNIETLEARCEELQRLVEELTSQLDSARRRAERQAAPAGTAGREPPSPVADVPFKVSTPIKSPRSPTSAEEAATTVMTREHEETLRLSDELRESKAAHAQEQRRTSELEEQLTSLAQDNRRLHEQLRDWRRRDDEPKSMHEEFSILEEVRQGQVCVRCLRAVERGGDDASSVMDDDDRSGISSLAPAATPTHAPASPSLHRTFHTLENGKDKLLQGVWSTVADTKDNPYRDLVEKYEALLEVQLSQGKGTRKTKQRDAAVSLQEELQTSGDFSQFSVKDTDEESGQGEEAPKPTAPQDKPQASRKKLAQTPDFSEAETSSSGFSDETSNKATQTERERPGSFLCTIADGEDYRFSIYDDASPMDSRFRNRPEYRDLFKEIFGILKKAAENKDDGERLPLLDDAAPGRVPPVTPANDEPPGHFTDDTQSVLSSVMSEQSVPMSDVTAPDDTLRESEPSVAETERSEVRPLEAEKSEPAAETSGKVLAPLVRQPMEYIAATRKKSRHRNRKHSADRQGAASPVFPSPPKITYQKSSGRKRRDYRPLETSPLAKPTEDWNGSTVQFYNRSADSPAPGSSGRAKVYQSWNAETDSWETKQSTASQEINKLRRLELSYAEVLRSADKTKVRRKKHQ